MPNDRYSIALWGPPASGKTWFIYAFAKKLLEDYAGDDDFFYEIRDALTGVPVTALSPEKNFEGTQGMADTSWLFKRTAKKETEGHKISTYEHLINVRDDKGAFTFRLEENDRTRQNIVNSDYLLVMLDPTLLPSQISTSKTSTPPITSKVREKQRLIDDSSILPQGDISEEILYEEDVPQEDALSTEITANEYAERLRFLFETLVKEGQNKHYYIAVCITKVDRLNVRQRDPWEIIQIFFGNSMHTFLKQYANMSQFTIETFSTSAFGFVGSVKPEANYHEGMLKNSNNWKPYNVEAPLFWLFEKVEREKLQNPSTGFLGKILFTGNRLNKYIPYRIKRR